MKKFINGKKIIILIFLLAITVRVIYVQKIPITMRQHDVGGMYGHITYIFTIYETNKLPETNLGQYYHPPLHHIISAIWLKIFDGIIEDENNLLESLQYLTLIYSILLIICIYKILKELKMKDKYKKLIFILMAFHPTFIILSGSINNDMLSILLIFYTIYRLIKWYKKSNVFNIVILAISTGLAVMTKTSSAIVSVPIIYIFLLQFFRHIKKEKDKKKIIIKYLIMYFIFGIISLSIGLWYPIRNYILFKQPILYVLEINQPKLYTGDYSLLSRFTPISKEIMEMYANPWTSHNIPTYVIKSSLFGEWIWGIDMIYEIIYTFALYCNIILIIYFIYSSIKICFLKSKKNIVYNNLLITMYIFNLISFIIMNIKLPYGCSMDFRYIVPSIFIGMYFIVRNLEIIKSKINRELIEIIIVVAVFFVLISNIILLF